MKKFALLIGVEEYEDRNITPVLFARADVLAVAERLRGQCGFNVVRALADASGPDAPRLINVLRILRDLAAELRAEDLFVFFFAGHGVEINGHGYLLTVDTLGAFPEQGSLSMSTMRQTFSRLAASNRILLLDTCRNDPDAARGYEHGSLAPSFCRDVLAVAQAQPKGRAARKTTTSLLSACSSGQRAWPYESKGHGVFTHYVLEGIDGAAWRENELEFEDLGRYVKDEVKRWCDAALGATREQDCWGEKFGLDRLVLASRVGGLNRRHDGYGRTDVAGTFDELESLQDCELAQTLDELERLQKANGTQ